jgi:hypothetical protein
MLLFEHYTVFLNTSHLLLPLLPLSILPCLIEIRLDSSLSVKAEMSFPYPTFQELEESAQAVIGYLKTFPQYSDAKVAIIGGMAVWKYFPNGRRTKVSIEEIALSNALFPNRLAGRGLHSQHSGCPKYRENQIASASKRRICTICSSLRLQASGGKGNSNRFHP